MKISGLLLLLFCCFSARAQATFSSDSVHWENITFRTADGRETPAERGTFSVPLVYGQEDSPRLQLRFVRFRSTSPNPGSPIVYLAGGPGGSGIETAKRSRYDLFQSLRTVADVIAFDQRGTGQSDGPPRYPELWMAPVDKPLNRDSIQDDLAASARQAADFFAAAGHPLSAYHTNASADDLNLLRQALGAEKISLWSISYGTHLALTTLKRHEAHLERLIMAGVEGYDHTVKLPADQEALLETIDALLKNDPRTAKVYPDFLGDVHKLLDKVATEPVVVATQHPFTRQPLAVTLGKFDLQILLAMSLRGPDSFRDLPLSVRQMLAGDFSSLAPYAAYAKMTYFQGMPLGMDLASGTSPERLMELKEQRKSTLLGDAINFPYLELRMAFPELDAGADFRAPFSSKVPVLAISGTLDGRTPLGNAQETLKHLPNGVHLLIDGAGHSDPLFLSSPRIEEVMLAFLRGEEIQEETIALPPVEFTQSPK
ncbi:MAG: alpha/beta fold hydrolase [Bacteroidota bacterium]